MKLKTQIPIFWLPLIAFWTFLYVLYSNFNLFTLAEFSPFIIYLIVSFLLVLQLQLVLVNKREGYLVKFGTTNILLGSLSLSSLFILLNIFGYLSNDWSIGLITLVLIMNTTIAEFLSYTSTQINKKKSAKLFENKTKIQITKKQT